MKITKENIKETLRSIMKEESEYQTFFKKALEKAGKSIPSMSDEEKKAFFNKIDAAWDGRGEKNEALVGNQHKLDIDGDGEIEASDLAALRAGKKKEESVKEGKKVFRINPAIGKAKYSISSHDGVKKHKDGSDFFDIETFKNKVDLANAIKKYTSQGFKMESVVNEEIKVGQMVKVVNNPHWEAALGKKGPFKRKVKGIYGDSVFFTDGSNSDMKYVKESVESVNEYNVNKKFGSKYDIGAGSMGNGTTFWNRAEEEFGDYKKIAHVSDSGEVKFYDKGLPSNVKKHIEDYAKTKKESVNEGRGFVAAAKKAKEEGKTEFEYKGKKYPVTIK